MLIITRHTTGMISRIWKIPRAHDITQACTTLITSRDEGESVDQSLARREMGANDADRMADRYLLNRARTLPAAIDNRRLPAN